MIYFVLTIDVEPDCSPTWHYSNPLTFNGVKIGIKEILHPLFMKYGIIPTYLINNVVLEDEESVNILRNLPGEYELGTHLHPEFIEPQKYVFEYAGSKGEANCCFLPPDVEYGKIKNITDLFERQFGYKPLSFRAGRFSAGKNTIKSLVKLGYKVDTSVTPHLKWNDLSREHPVNYSNCPEQPYFTSANNFPFSHGQDKRFLEVPVSIYLKNNFLLIEYIKSIFGLRREIIKNRPVWLRPCYSNYNDFKQLVNYFKENFLKHESITLNMMFHNVEVLPSLSPYTNSEAECQLFSNTLEAFFLYLKINGTKSIKLNSLHEIYQ